MELRWIMERFYRKPPHRTTRALRLALFAQMLSTSQNPKPLGETAAERRK